MRKLIFAAVLLALFASAQARFFFGFPGGVAYNGEVATGLAGLQFGTYNLYDDFGIRALAQFGSDGADSFVQGGLDGLYAFGDSIVFYTGAGLGYAAEGSAGGVYIDGFVGLDFDAASAVSVFLEITPNYVFGGNGFVQIRSGLNIHVGDPGDNPVSAKADSQPWLEPYSAETNP